MLTLRECLLLDIRSAGSILRDHYPAEADQPGWLESKLLALGTWFFSPKASPDQRGAALTLLPTTARLHSATVADPSPVHAEAVGQALADVFAVAGEFVRQPAGAPAPRPSGPYRSSRRAPVAC